MSNDDFFIKQGDLAPPLEVVLTDNGAPVNLSNATSIVFVVKDCDEQVVIDVNNLLGDAAGNVVYAWQDGDTAVPGPYRGEFTVMWPTRGPQTFPGEGAVKIRVGASIRSLIP